MKTFSITSLLIILSLPAFANSAQPAGSPFDNATDIQSAIKIFETKTNDIINTFDSNRKFAEKTELKKFRNEILNTYNNTQEEVVVVVESEPEANQTTTTTITPEPKQNSEEQEQKIAELRKNADAAKEKEQSTANKLLGAAGIGATGMGAMQLASGMAEQKADEEAEAAMRAYLATFSCKYGNQTVAGGTKNVEIAGGNELINLYSEYVNLANDLKVRKSALGIKPGIESESILDSATSGLYDDVSVGKTGGAYASLARALSNPTGEDAQKWKAQQEESAKDKKTGAITAGVGAGASLIGNIAVNITEKVNEKKETTKQDK